MNNDESIIKNILNRNGTKIDEVNGFYFMANNNLFNGKSILTILMKNGNKKKIPLKECYITPLLCLFADNNIPFLNLHTNLPIVSHSLPDKSYVSISNNNYFIFLACMIIILGIVSLFPYNTTTASSLQPYIQYPLGIACLILGCFLLNRPSVKIEGNILCLKKLFYTYEIDLKNIIKVTVSLYGKGDMIGILTKDYKYYRMSLNGMSIKTSLFVANLSSLGIDASSGYYEYFL